MTVTSQDVSISRRRSSSNLRHSDKSVEVKNLKDLGQIIDLCRKKGVDSIEIQGIRLSFKGEPVPTKYQRRKEQDEVENTPFVDEISQNEAALFWSSTPLEGAN